MAVRVFVEETNPDDGSQSCQNVGTIAMKMSTSYASGSQGIKFFCDDAVGRKGF